MKIVITHANPDFDAISSAYAALLIHNADHIATITSYDANVTEYLKKTELKIPIIQYAEKDIDLVTSIDELIITDCKQLKRIGKFAKFLDIAKRVVIYDHHPTHQADINGDFEIVKTIGSTTTILTKIIEENNISLSSEQATLFAIGIYEDTGLLTFSNTTPDDALAVAYLLSQDANLEVVSDSVKRDLSKLQVFILNDLLSTLSFITTSGINIAVAHATVDEYYDDVSSIAQKLMQIESLDSLFILISTGGRVVIVGRSNTKLVDVSSIVKSFGGGGHASAGSATIKDLLLQEALDILKLAIQENVHSVKLANEVMTSPVKFVSTDTTLHDALDITMKYNLTNMPVVDINNKTVGIVSRKDLLYGVKHGLQLEPINVMMNSEFDTVTPDTLYSDAQRLIVSKGYKLLPVEENGELVGVITRTDILRILSDNLSINNGSEITNIEYENYPKIKNIKSLLKSSTPPIIQDMIKVIKELADQNSTKIYLVGGFVRDIFIKKENFDLDFVIEGDDATIFATELAKKLDARTSIHNDYKTASVILNDGTKLDFATARIEHYIKPGALPTVEEASIRNDLFRRDFTINAMAIRLDGDHYGELIDYFRGQEDIIGKKIRVLHSLSFIDDPTRAFRAIRFAVRFDFDIGSHTKKLMKHAVSIKVFDRVVGLRLYTELKLILKENSFMRALDMLKTYNLLSFFSKKIALDQIKLDRFTRLTKFVSWHSIEHVDYLEIWKMRFYILLSNLNAKEFEELLVKLSLSDKTIEHMKKDFNNINHAVKLFNKTDNIKPSKIVEVCSQISIEATILISVMSTNGNVDIAKEYLGTYRNITTEINGNDLIKLDIPKGKIYAEILEEVKNAKLDSIVNGYQEEIDFAKKTYSDIIKK